jgi:hypothetical protein
VITEAPELGPAVGSGEWLLSELAHADTGEARWLRELAEFDLRQEWLADGALSCVEWLMWLGRMGRSSAYEKLQVAHELRRRPVLFDAMSAGRVSYSAIRVLARLRDPDPEVDEALLRLAEVGSVRDLERMAAVYRAHLDQHRAPADPSEHRGVKVRPGVDGTTTIEITLEHLEALEVLAALDAFAEVGPPSSAEQSTRADSRAWSEVRADAVVEMARTAVRHRGDEPASGEDRYMVHVVQTAGETTLLDGTPIDAAAAARLRCDSSAAPVLLGPGWEPLAMGWRTRTWTVAQRRAIRIRDGGRCRFPGCERRRVDAHHHRPWGLGGPTDVANGFLLCPRHHTLVHSGWSVEGDPDYELTFRRPDGSPLPQTATIRRTWVPAERHMTASMA